MKRLYHLKNILFLFLIVIAVGNAFLCSNSVNAWDFSPYVNTKSALLEQDPWNSAGGNYFPVGQCTWYVWGQVKNKTGQALPYTASDGAEVFNSNAKWWYSNAEYLGWKMTQEPAANTIAVWPWINDYGHVAYVERVENGRVGISDFNFNWSLDYSEDWYRISDGSGSSRSQNTYAGFSQAPWYIYLPWVNYDNPTPPTPVETGEITNLGDKFEARIVSVPAPSYAISGPQRSLASDKTGDFLTLQNKTNSNTTSAGKAQIWEFYRNSDGSYYVKNKLNRSQAMDVANTGNSSNENVYFWAYGADTIKSPGNKCAWFLQKKKNGSYRLVPRSSQSDQLGIDIKGGAAGAKAGTELVLYNAAGSGQEWQIEKVSTASQSPSIVYSVHVQQKGDMPQVKNGAVAGTTGQSLRMENIKVALDLAETGLSGGVTYRTHVQRIGWQDYVSNGAVAGTSGKSLRMEAIQLKLTGSIAKLYDVYYRVHAQRYGWMAWAKNGEMAGTSGYGYRLEGIQIMLVSKSLGVIPTNNDASYKTSAYIVKPTPKVLYQTHVQGIGWQDWKYDGALSGTVGNALRLEALKVKIENLPYTGGISYSAHVQRMGWQGVVKDGELAGTTGKALRLEAIKLYLTGEMANNYDVYYRVHCQSIGWTGWAKNGAPAGTQGYGYRMEALEVRLIEKGKNAPGIISNTFIRKA